MPGVGADQELDIFQSLQRILIALNRAQLDLHLSARHAQLLDLAGDRLGQFLGSFLADTGQLACQLLIVLLIGRQFFGQPFPVRIILLDAFQLIDQPLLQGRQFIGVDPVLACQVVDDAEALVDLLLALRVGFEMIQVTGQLADRFLYLDLRPGQQVMGFVQAAAMLAQGTQSPEAGVEGLQHAAAVAFPTDIDHLLAGMHDLFGIGQLPLFTFQLLQFTFLQAEVVQLFQLVAEQLQAGVLLITDIAGLLQGLFGLAAALGGQLYLAGQLAGVGVLIQQAAVSVGLEQ